MAVKPIILVTFTRSSLSGGYSRLYEILKRGKSAGINYVIVTDSKSCENAVNIFPDFMEIIGQYKVISRNFRKADSSMFGLKQVSIIKRIIKQALFISKVAQKEDADLILNPDEGIEQILVCYIASKFSTKPWTAIFQPTEYRLQPSYSLEPLNPINVRSHIKSKAAARKLSFRSEIGLSCDLLALLKVAEKTPILAVSNSVVEDFGYMDPRINFITINLGNGIELSKFSKKVPQKSGFDAVFFGRLIQEKGIFDLIDIWKLVVNELPNAKLAVCGIPENAELLKKFLKELHECNESNNIEFLGQQEYPELLNVVGNSSLTIYPSYVDAFSIVTLESLACGTAVVAYDIPAIRHNFGHCKSVFRSPIGDKKSMANAIIRVLTKFNQKKLAIEAKKFASSYDWDNIVEAEKEAYLKVISCS